MLSLTLMKTLLELEILPCFVSLFALLEFKKDKVEDISKNLYTLTDQVNQYMVQQGTNAQSQLPSTPPTFTGLDEEDTPTP